MNNQLSVVIGIDVEAALNTNSLSGNVHCFDTSDASAQQSFDGSSHTTNVIDNQIVNWLAQGIDWLNPEYSGAYISAIKGEAVDKRVLFPTLYDSPSLLNRGYWWGGMVVAREPGVYQYTLTIALNKVRSLDLNLYLDVTEGFIMSEPPDLQPAVAM